MTDIQAIWTTAQATMMAFSPFYQVAMVDAIQASGAAAEWFTVKQALAASPFTIDDYHQLAPYTNQATQVDRLADLAEKGLLAPAGGGYEVTAKGRDVVESIFKGAHESLAAVAPLSAAEMGRTAALLARIVAATEQAAQPASKIALRSSRVTTPAADAAPAALIDQFLTDLLTFRDDAHVAAWQPLGVTGSAWEALTFIWREQANSATALAERLPFRGNDAEVYETALQDLADRGWIEAGTDGYAITGAGRAVREQAEADTEKFFFVGWDALNDAELAELHGLLSDMGAALRQAGEQGLWQLTLAVSGAIGEATRGATKEVFAAQFDQPGYWFPALLARGTAPAPFSAALFGRRGPYTNPARTEKTLADAAEAGYFLKVADGYQLTEKGSNALDAVDSVFYRFLTDLETLPANQLNRLDGLLARLAAASRESAVPAEKWNIETIHGTNPEDESYGPLARIDQHIDELGAFRDDSHIAAWADHDLDGRAWEAFSYVHDEKARNGAELAEKLPFRGYTAADYDAALNDLVARGWLQPAGDGFAITAAGSAVRAEAEQQTNAFFFSPWQTLNGQELGQLQLSLTRLKDQLEALTAKPEAA